MMNSRRRNNRGLLIATTILVVILFGIDRVSGGGVRSITRATGSVIFRAMSTLSPISPGGFFSTRASLIAQNASLQDQIARLQERDAADEALRQENDQLRALVHLAQGAPGVTAPIVSSFRVSPYGTFAIGAGAADGVMRGALVLTAEGFAVGRIADTGGHNALVSEFFAPGASIEGQISGASVVLEGDGQGSAHATIPRGVIVQTGQAVIAPTLGARPVGIIGHVASSSASASQTVYVQLPVNLSGLQFVYVVSP